MLEARHQINEALLSYCRGIDRLRANDVKAGFLPGAMLHGYGSADAAAIEDFADYAVTALGERYLSTQHRISNTRIEFAEDAMSAVVETYVEASHVAPFDPDLPGHELHLFVGRYIDTCRPDADGIWKIADRTLRNDWSSVSTIGEPMAGDYVPSGRGDELDPLFDSPL